MSSIHEDPDATPLEKAIHRCFHEIEERTDTHVDKVSEIIDLWEEWKDKNLTLPKK